MASQSTEAARKPRQVTISHPDDEAYFQEIATPKKVIKEVRTQYTTISCAECRKPSATGEKLQRCSKCKTSAYCSRECQKKHWPLHKHACVQTTFSPLKIINCFVANAVLSEFIAVAAIILFGLDTKPAPLDVPLVAECHARMTPNLKYHMGLLTNSLSPAQLAEGTQGLLQLHSFHVNPTGLVGLAGQGRLELWNYIKARNAPKLPNITIVLVDFYINESIQAISAGVAITDSAMQMVKDNEGFVIESAVIRGQKKVVPMTIDSCLSFINKHIRSDEHNQLSLRAHMTKDDIDEYRRETVDKNISGYPDVDFCAPRSWHV